MSAMLNPPLDSKEGAQMLIDFACRGRFVLNEWHEELAKRHGIETDGVIFARPIPLENNQD